MKDIKKIYNKIKFSSLPLSLIYENTLTAEKYFCTPIGAKIFARLGVDGVHFCTVAGFGETVFAVNPSNCEGQQVFPVAHDLKEFLELVLTLGGAGLIDQIPLFTKEKIEKEQSNFLEQMKDDEAWRCDIERLKNTFGIEMLTVSPYELVREISDSFDHSRLRFKKEKPIYATDFFSITEIKIPKNKD